jgi:O-antigen/teichoic acid export membrane protein
MTDNSQSNTFEKELLSKSLFFSFSLYVRIFFKLLSGIFVAKLLGPSLFGLKNAYDLAIGYESYSDIGVFSALNRQAPFYRGEKNFEKARICIGSVFGINLYYASIAAIVMIAVSQYLGYRGYEQKYVDFALFWGAMIFTGKVNAFLQTKLKIDQRFYVLSIIQLLYGFTASILSVPLTYFWGFRGLLISLLTADVVCIGYFLLKERKFPEVIISFGLYWQLLKIGFPLMILFVLLMLLNSADRTLILAMMSEKELGYFGIATVATGVITTIPNAVHNVTVAPVMEKLGRTNNSLSIKSYFTDPMFIMAYFLPVIISCIYFAIHLPIEYYLYKYTPSISVVKIMMIGVYFEAVASPSLSISLAFNKQMRLICIVIPMVALNFGLNYILIKLGWGINGVAMGTSITFFAYFCVLLYFASVQFGENFYVYLSNLSMVLIPFGYSSVLIFSIDKCFEYEINNLWSDIMITSAKIVIFILIYCMMIYRTIRKNSSFVKLFASLASITKTLKLRFFGRSPL